MRSDWHRYNQKRKIADLPPVSSEDYNAKVLAAQATNKEAAARAAYVQTCPVCRKTYYSEHAFQNHIASKAHRQRENAALRGDHLSLNGSAVSKSESQPSEPRDPEAEAEFDKVVAGLKDTSIQEPSPVQRRPSAPSPETIPKAEHPMSPEKAITTAPLSRCLFCNYDSPTFKLSVLHMTKIHGLFIPEQNYLIDLEGLVGYLQAKILTNNECVWCHQLKGSADAVQAHMRDKSHCRIAFESEEEMIEVGQFYDFSSTYSDPEQDSDTEMDETKAENGGAKLSNGRGEDEGWETDSSFSSLDSNELTSVPIDDRTRAHGRLHLHRHHSQTDPRPHKAADGWHSHAHSHNNAVFYDEYEMHLPSGRVAGHRSLKKYYRQNLHAYPTTAERMARAHRLIEEGSSGDEEMEDVESNPPATPPRNSALMRRGEAGMIGVTDARRRQVRGQEQRSRHKEMRAQSRYQAKVEKQANSQKHFRVSLTLSVDLFDKLTRFQDPLLQ